MDLDRFRYYTAWHRHANRRQYDAPADPWRLVHVDPTAVEWCTNEIRLNWGLGRVEGGDWDRAENCHRIEETVTWEGLVQRFEDGRDWEETAYYERAERQFEDRGSLRGYESLAAYRETRLAYIDDLYESIRDEGYRPNADAGHRNPAASDNPFEDAYANHLDPLVVVGRSGEIIWTEGYHRLIIASILDLDEIPVLVLCRHEEWQRAREEFARRPASERGDELESVADHPDLVDVPGGD